MVPITRHHSSGMIVISLAPSVKACFGEPLHSRCFLHTFGVIRGISAHLESVRGSEHKVVSWVEAGVSRLKDKVSVIVLTTEEIIELRLKDDMKEIFVSRCIY